MTQKVLNVMDSEDVNTLSDSIEAVQVANIIEDVYFDLIASREIPTHKGLIKLTGLSDNNFPTHFLYGTNVKEIETLSYDRSETVGETDYKEVCWVEPMEFLSKTDGQTTDTLLVADKVAGTTLTINTDSYPTIYTSFDGDHIVMNAYKSTVESTLQASKSRAYGTVYPTFSISDSFVPDLPEVMFPYFLAESKSTCMSVLKGENNPKVEQNARRQKNWVQKNKDRTKKDGTPNGYGR